MSGRMVRAAAAAAALLLWGQAASAAPAGPAQDAHLAAMARRLFPELVRLASGPEEPALRAMLAARARRIDACAEDAPCVLQAAAWTAAEQDQLAGAAARLPSEADDGASAQARRELKGLNHLLEVYGLGQPPPYPEIDGPDGKPADREVQSRLADAVAIGRAARGDAAVSLDPSVPLALALLDVNDRDEPVAYEPLARENAPALARARRLDWSRYRYAALVIPGIGPEVVGEPLSPTGKLNVRLAAARFARGDAPFIVLTGGRAHPRRTRFSEAVEMRRALIERYGVPADAIVIEPYARHTTTNLRNVARRLFELGAPAGLQALIVTYPFQSRYIESPGFADRCRRELGYLPGTIGPRLSPTELVFRPARQSLRVDPFDPLDP